MESTGLVDGLNIIDYRKIPKITLRFLTRAKLSRMIVGQGREPREIAQELRGFPENN